MSFWIENIFEVKRQLDDKIYCKKLEKPIYMKTIPLVDNFIQSEKEKILKFETSYEFKRRFPTERTKILHITQNTQET